MADFLQLIVVHRNNIMSERPSWSKTTFCIKACNEQIMQLMIADLMSKRVCNFELIDAHDIVQINMFLTEEKMLESSQCTSKSERASPI